MHGVKNKKLSLFKYYTTGITRRMAQPESGGEDIARYIYKIIGNVSVLKSSVSNGGMSDSLKGIMEQLKVAASVVENYGKSVEAVAKDAVAIAEKCESKSGKMLGKRLTQATRIVIRPAKDNGSASCAKESSETDLKRLRESWQLRFSNMRLDGSPAPSIPSSSVDSSLVTTSAASQSDIVVFDESSSDDDDDDVISSAFFGQQPAAVDPTPVITNSQPSSLSSSITLSSSSSTSSSSAGSRLLEILGNRKPSSTSTPTTPLTENIQPTRSMLLAPSFFAPRPMERPSRESSSSSMSSTSSNGSSLSSSLGSSMSTSSERPGRKRESEESPLPDVSPQIKRTRK